MTKRRERVLPWLSMLAALVAAPSAAVAQGNPPAERDMTAAESAMEACAASAAAGRHAEAAVGAVNAELAFRSRLSRHPDDVRALVGLARTLGQCRIPGADLMQRGELSAESIDLLRRALDIQPDHWQARYILALNYFRAPAFLGRTADAARELDRLILMQGSRNDVREFARPYELRGLIWSRTGAADSAAAVWRRGLALFPEDTALQARLKPTGGAGTDDTGSLITDSTTAGETTSLSSDAAPATVDTVRIVASRLAPASSHPQPSVRVVTRSEVMIAAGATADVIQAVQLQPGATRVSEGSDLYSRGGDPSETATLVDGGRIVSVARFESLNGGTLAAVDPSVVRAVRYSTGGFSVRHGNSLSGVLEIDTDSRPRDAHWRAGLGLTQAGATAKGPLGERRGGFATVRATHAGALLRTHGRSREFATSPFSVEGMAAFIAQPKVGTEYRVLGLVVRDASARLVDANGFSGPFDSRGATDGVVVSTSHLARSVPVVVRTSLAASQRASDWSFGVLARERTERSAVARVDIDYAVTGEATIRGGIETGRFARSDEGTVPATISVAPGSPVRLLPAVDTSSSMAGAFVEGELPVGRVRVLAGVRADRLPGERDVTLDPRISVSTGVGPWTARVAAGQFHQGRWRAEASVPDGGTPSGLPRRARHLVLGVERQGPVGFRGEAFIKSYGEYGSFGAGPQVVHGMARGVDVQLRHPTGTALTGWIGYSFLDSEVRLVDGSSARSPNDITHTLTGSGTLRIARSTTLGSTLRYGTGRPFTPITGGFEDAGQRLQPVYGATTSERLPDYVRWDVRAMQYLPLRRSLLAGFVEVLNMANRENVSGYVWSADYANRRAANTFYSRRTVIVGVEIQSR